MTSRARFDLSPIQRTIDRVESMTGKKLLQAQTRAIVSTSRALKAEAAKQVSAIQLNLTPRQISPYISVKQGSVDGKPYVSVYASNTRLPLTAFGATLTKGSGAAVTTWRDSPALILPHAFRAQGKIWQRIPRSHATKQYADKGTGGKFGLVGRLPITERKGPSLKRALQPAGPSTNSHGREDVVAALKSFTADKLHSEMQRLTENL